jgi:hypothetical protein
MDVREAIDSQGDLHNNSVAHPLETLGPRLFPTAAGGGRSPPPRQGSKKKWQGSSISAKNWRTIVFLVFCMTGWLDNKREVHSSRTTRGQQQGVTDIFSQGRQE